MHLNQPGDSMGVPQKNAYVPTGNQSALNQTRDKSFRAKRSTRTSRANSGQGKSYQQSHHKQSQSQKSRWTQKPSSNSNTKTVGTSEVVDKLATATNSLNMQSSGPPGSKLTADVRLTPVKSESKSGTAKTGPSKHGGKGKPSKLGTAQSESYKAVLSKSANVQREGLSRVVASKIPVSKAPSAKVATPDPKPVATSSKSKSRSKAKGKSKPASSSSKILRQVNNRTIQSTRPTSDVPNSNDSLLKSRASSSLSL